MDKILKKILMTIEKANFEAYLVGGYVRDYLMGIKSCDIDICTNALPKDLHKLFPQNNTVNNYGGFNLKIKKYNIDITTYRKELKYENRKPIEVIYINDLEEDIKRRDFTINSVCMDKNEKVIDLVNGVGDINKRVIRMLGNIPERLKEDPLRILRAIRFACILNFNIEDNLYQEIKNNYKLVSTLSNVRIKEEITKILLSKNYQKGLNLLKETKILDILGIKYNEVYYVNDICGMWAQLELTKDYAFTKQENRNIINIKQILKIGKIDNEVLYKYGLYTSLVAAEIMQLNKKQINKMYQKLPLESAKDLQIENKEIMEILNILPSKKLNIIRQDLIDKILKGELPNNNKKLRNYLQSKGETYE